MKWIKWSAIFVLYCICLLIIQYRDADYAFFCGKVFKNHGAQAGASLSHSHSQILGLPLVPPLVTSRLSSMEEHFKKAGKCGICELRDKELVVDESTYFYSIVPFAAAYPFEIWIVPKEHFPHFHKLDDEKVTFYLWCFFFICQWTCIHCPALLSEFVDTIL